MKARVLKQFRDKDDFSKVYKVGDTIDLSRDRFKYLQALGLVVEIREKTKTSKTNE